MFLEMKECCLIFLLRVVSVSVEVQYWPQNISYFLKQILFKSKRVFIRNLRRALETVHFQRVLSFIELLLDPSLDVGTFK